MDTGRLGPLVKGFKKSLYDPLQLRIIVGLATLAAWGGLVYLPMSEATDEAIRQRAMSEAHATAARDIEALRTLDARYKSRLPTGTDPNEWVEYMLVGVRATTARLNKLETQSLRKHGAFDVAVLRIEIQGEHVELMKLLAWIETNPRIFRVDAFSLTPYRGGGGDLVLNLTVLGVMG
jgi:hypothetical protein